MAHLIEALSSCNSSTIALILSSSGLPAASDSFGVADGSNLVSVGDGIFQLLSVLNSNVSELPLIIKPFYKYLSGQLYTSSASGRISRLSEPLLWLLLRVLDCSASLKSFLDMGGVQVICRNLVTTNRHVINTSPSLISSIMQYYGTAVRPSGLSGRRPGTYTTESSSSLTDSSLQNFALLGTISSSSPSASPPDVLIQGTAPHRRARTAAWSYHFYPDEAWVDLTISLPCAVLLKEVVIQPHLTSLATCPAAVTVEGSRDGGAAGMVPLSAPVSTSGLTTIKIQLVRHEIVSVITIRLHKPRDSQTIGLSQIMLMGYMAFSETNVASRLTNVLTPMEDYVSRTSIGWLRLLHHCLTQSDELRSAVTQAAAPTTDLLLTCTTLLMSTSALVYASSIESVLLTLGLHSVDLGLSLIDHILRRTTFIYNEGRFLSPHGKIHGKATESTVEILYRLGTHQDVGLLTRMKALMNWLGDSARVALQRAHGSVASVDGTVRYHMAAPPNSSCVGLPTPAVAHVHVVAAILWHNHGRVIDMKQIISRDLLSCVYQWSLLLNVDCALKRAVDSVLCSMCHVDADCFTAILEWIGIVRVSDGTDTDTDDVKGGTQQQRNEPLTDDVKADSGTAGGSSRSRQSFVSLTRGAADIRPMAMNLDNAHLLTLSVVCQSPAALQQLIDSDMIATLCAGLCVAVGQRLSDAFDVDPSVSMATDAAKQCIDLAGPARNMMFASSAAADASLSQLGQTMTVDLLSATLRFLAEIAKDTVMKEWLGQADNCAFWVVLLRALCTTGSTYLLVRPPSCSILTIEQQMAIESAAIEFFSNVISCHAKNQLTFALVVCDVIQSQRSVISGCSSLLSGFLRRLFLQVLLEDERVLVSMKSSQPMYKGQQQSMTGLMGRLQHPKFGVGHCCRCMTMSVHSTFADVLAKVSVETVSSSSSSADDSQKASDELRKDASELGIEVIDQISAVAAGLKAKEKRDKDKSVSRPPGRHGTRSNDQSSQQTTAGSGAVMLYHQLIPDIALPADMTLSQLLRFLYEHNIMSPGDSCLQLAMKQSNVEPQTEAEASSDDVLTSLSSDSASLSSALQVFSSVGGLALLAEHLPLLYPEFSRQSTPVDMLRDMNGSAGSGAVGGMAGAGVGIGHDWVTVESAEEIYEEIYEPPMPPSPPSQHKQSSSPVLSIPPHSLVAFGLFLRLPGYAEVLLKEKRKARCLLRLIFGVTDDGEGGHILMSTFARELPTLPFFVLKTLFDVTPLTTDDGVVLRRMTLDIGVVHLILACLSVLGHHAPRQPIPGFHQEIIMAATQAATSASTAGSSGATQQKSTTEEKAQSYWAKGTGFGTGSTTSSWDAEQALLRQKSEEEHVTCFLQVLASYINPGGLIPKQFEATDVDDDDEECCEPVEQSLLPFLLPELLAQSCLVPALSSYLRNDSVLDMACHVPLYRSLLEILRAIAVCPPLMPLLLPLDAEDDSTVSLSSLLDKMKQCVDTYASRLRGGKMNGKSSVLSKQRHQADDEEAEGLALLIPDIQETARIVNIAVRRIQDKSKENEKVLPTLVSMRHECGLAGRLNHSEEERYIAVMKELQFDTYKMVQDDAAGVHFVVPHHYETNVKAAGDVNNAARSRRLAQEAVTLSTSLPLSAGSSVFVRCDEERLDVMKVLMTGPSDTPYANGCFEFDVYFPVDYPNSPPLINLETTGNHTVRFNPNLYNDGKVCLSVLNTWHGRPEEKWNSQTSSFLQVLVSIQSLILVSEPYFNEPGYERSRGTPSGTASSREYDANIRQASTKWAMLEMLRNPPACFKQVVEWHFWLKKKEILSQVEDWLTDLEAYSSDKRVGRSIAHSCASLKRHYSQLKDELQKLKAPSDSVSCTVAGLALHSADCTNCHCPDGTLAPSDDIDTAPSQYTPPSVLPCNGSATAETTATLVETTDTEALSLTPADVVAAALLSDDGSHPVA
jgi:baculoviral IAP repeat-containing protein 6